MDRTNSSPAHEGTISACKPRPPRRRHNWALAVAIGLSCVFAAACESGAIPNSLDPFAAGSISSPSMGYIDSIFINASGDRIYFLHSVLSANDFLGGTVIYPQAPFLPGHQGQGTGVFWNSDLYVIAWTGSAWGTPENLGSQINTLGNECCVWLNPEETEIIFFRDNLTLPIGPSGNFVATRPSRSHPWGTPVALPGDYGTTNQNPSAGVYRHDIHKTASGDLYLWENGSGGNGDELIYGRFNGSGYDLPVLLTAANSVRDETQVWVSPDERTMLLNRRDAISGETELVRLTRPDTTSAWGGLFSLPVAGFADAAGRLVWGEPTLPASQSHLLFIRFETSALPWQAQIMYAPGNPATGFGAAVKLN